MRNLVAENFTDGADFLAVADRRRRAVRVDIIDIALHGRQRLTHAANGPFARGCDPVKAVGGRAVADDFGIDLGTALLGMFQFLEDEHTSAAGDDETVTAD